MKLAIALHFVICICRSQALSSIASTLSQSGRIDESISIAQAIDDNNRSQSILEIILNQLKFEKSFSKELMKMITYDIANSKYKIITNSLHVSKELWNYLMKQCIGYHEITYSICSLVAKRYPQKSSEIADVILKCDF
jgi:hypothetical protein